jgi:acid phosphatase
VRQDDTVKTLVMACVLCLVAGCGTPTATPPASRVPAATSSVPSTSRAPSVTSGAVPTTSAPAVPRPDHVVVVVEENRSYADVIGRPDAPYLNSLAARGALFTSSFAVSHPSEPNYLALFSGATQGLTDDSCPHTFPGANLGAQLLSAGFTFAGYSEGLPAVGATVCSAGSYARKHNPWVDFAGVPAAANQPFSAFPGDYTRLPTVSFVIPDLADDMHDGSVGQGDGWLRANLDGYARWAVAHRSLLIVTWDEDDFSQANQVPTIVVGGLVKPGRYAERIDHYSVLHTVEAAYGLPAIGVAAAPVTDCWAAN